ELEIRNPKQTPNPSFEFVSDFEFRISAFTWRNHHMAKEKEVQLKVRPLDDRVVVEPLEAEEKTAGGILLPDSAKQKPQRGRVLAVGPGRLRDSGERSKLAVVVGDEVLYGRYSGNDVEVSGKEVKIMREGEILGKVVK